MECSSCRVNKEISEFGRNKSRKNGLNPSCRECSSEYNRKYKLENKEKLSEYDRKYKLENKEKLKIQGLKYFEQNIDKIKEYRKNYKKPTYKYKYNPTEDRKKYKNEWIKNDRKNRPWYYLQRDLLNRIIKTILYKKTGSTIEELGYSSLELKSHIESLFIDNMTWENYGEWHVDHIYPISKFDKGQKANIINALSNLQPLWKRDNLEKHNKII